MVNDAPEAMNGAAQRPVVNVVNQRPLRIPDFWPRRVIVWFRLVEAEFELSNVTSDETKFNTVLSLLGEKHIDKAEDAATNPPAERKYEALKAELIKNCTDSDSTRVRKLLESQEMGDRTPSQFYRELKKLATSTKTEEFVLTLWKNQLPTEIQRVLAATTETTAVKLTELADRIYEIRPKSSHIAAVEKESEIDQLRKELAKMQASINALVKQRGRSRSRKDGRERDRSRSKSRREEGVCWYHDRYKERATKCKSPCKWSSGNGESRRQ